MDTLELILAEIKKKPPIAVIRTAYNGNDAYFTIIEVIPCLPDIYAVFFDPKDDSLYALQNVGSQFWVKFHNDLGEENTKHFLLPVTNFLMENRENCIKSFIKTCRLQDLREIPIREDSLINPFIHKEILEKLTSLSTN